jgi:predicted dehydrogenase
MIERERLDAIDVVTRPETHTALVGLGASRGVHVLCQKPLAPTLAEARAMVETAEGAGVRFMVAEMWRHLPWFRDLRRQIDAGAVGEPYHLRVVGARSAMRREPPVHPNQPYFAAMPMLIVYEMMIHWIDPARYLLGEVETVCDRVAIIDRGRVVRYGALAELLQESLALDLALGPHDDATLRLIEEYGAIEAREVNQLRVRLDDFDDVPRLVEALVRAGVAVYGVTPHRRSLEDVFLGSVEGGTEG